MRYKRYIITLEITIDTETEGNPNKWDWYTLLDTQAPDPNINVIDISEADTERWMIFNQEEGDGWWDGEKWNYNMNEAIVYHDIHDMELPGVWYPI